MFSGIVTGTDSLPPAPTLVSPPDSTVGLTGTVPIQWASTADSLTYYHVQASRNPLFDTIDVELNLLTQLNDTLTGLILDTVYYWRVNAENAGGVSAYSPTWNFRTGIVDVREPQQPESFSLYQNYPNPFSDATSFSFTLPESEPVQLRIYNVLGETIATAASGRFAAGMHDVQWNANSFPPGLYYYSLQAGTFSARKSMMVIR
jgi:hypothetical protein